MTFRKPAFRYLPFIVCGVLLASVTFSQQIISSDSLKFDYNKPQEYVIGGVKVSGSGTLDQEVLKSISGLSVGDKIKIPGDAIATAIKNLWKEGFFEDVKIVATKVQEKNVFLEIQVKERPRLSKFSFTGIKNHEADDLREKLKLNRGKVVTDNLVINTKNTVLDHFVKKGFLNAQVVVAQKKDSTLQNSIILYVKVKKGNKVRIKQITFHGNTALSQGKLRRSMKDTKQKKWYSIFTSAEYIESDFDLDKEKIIEKYQSNGYRDAKVVKDSVYKIESDRLAIDIWVNEGKKYYFRHITWVGNSKYSSKDLDKVLGIKKGDVFNQSVLDARLNQNPNGTDVSSLYMDDGYLFFQVTPVEVLVEGDSIDMEMHIYEGKQATINKVTVKGNTKTNDHVIMREIRTRPGQLFRRSDIIRSQRELSVLGYFNAEKLGVTPTPHPENGTVDIEYQVEEKSSDQLELSGGFGNGMIIGTLGVTFNNFSARNFFNGSAWQPLPSGDGQRLSIRGSSSGLLYRSINMSFIEPWLGGKKPNSFSVSTYYNMLTNGVTKDNPTYGAMHIFGSSVGLGRRRKVPDDFFIEQFDLGYQYYDLHNYTSSGLAFTNGFANDLNGKYTIARNSIDDMTFPKSGSENKFLIQATPPWSLIRKELGYHIDYADVSPEQKYKLLEFFKLKFTSAWYTKLFNIPGHPIVLYTKLGYGWMGLYNKAIGLTPFERFYLGGSGLTGYNPFDGREVIALRGYDAGDVYAFPFAETNPGAASIAKYTMELRFPISLNPSATIYLLTFAEAGNSWSTIKEFNPFDVNRSAGVGVRFFLPMFGQLGFDYGWRFDNIPYQPGMQKSQFSFTIGQNLGEL